MKTVSSSCQNDAPLMGYCMDKRFALYLCPLDYLCVFQGSRHLGMFLCSSTISPRLLQFYFPSWLKADSQTHDCINHLSFVIATRNPWANTIIHVTHKKAHIGIEPLKTNQTRCEWHHNTFTPSLHLVPFFQLCLVFVRGVHRRVEAVGVGSAGYGVHVDVCGGEWVMSWVPAAM